MVDHGDVGLAVGGQREHRTRPSRVEENLPLCAGDTSLGEVARVGDIDDAFIEADGGRGHRGDLGRVALAHGLYERQAVVTGDDDAAHFGQRELSIPR